MKRIAPGYYQDTINGHTVEVYKNEEGGFWSLSIDGIGSDSADTKAELLEWIEIYKERGDI